MNARKKDEEKKEGKMNEPGSMEALRANSELLSLFMRHSPVYAYIKSVTPTESRILQASDNYQRMLGSSGLDIVGKTMEELFPPGFAEKMTADDWAAVANGSVLQTEKELDERSYISIKFPFMQGNKHLLAGYMLDITERKQAEETLKKREKLFKEEQQAGEEKLREGEARLRDIEGKLQEIDGKIREGQGKLQKVGDMLRAAEGKLQADGDKLKWIEGKLQEAGDKLRDGEEKLRGIESKLQDVEKKLQTGEDKLRDGEGKLQDVEKKLQAAGDKLRDGEAKFRDVEEKLREGEDKLRENEGKLRDVGDKLRKGESELKDVNEKLRNGKEALRKEETTLASLKERDILLREFHNDVRNNMSSVIALMEIQRMAQEKSPGKLLSKPGMTDAAFSALENRIRSIALLHEHMYQSQNPSRVDFQDYLSALVAHLRTSLEAPPEILCSVDAAGVALKLDAAVPVGIIVNELVTNAFKYAFPRNQPQFGADKCEIRVSLERKDTEYTLSVEDNGAGLPKMSAISGTSALGVRLVKMLGVDQLGGKLRVSRAKGTRFELKFNVKE